MTASNLESVRKNPNDIQTNEQEKVRPMCVIVALSIQFTIATTAMIIAMRIEGATIPVLIV